MIAATGGTRQRREESRVIDRLFVLVSDDEAPIRRGHVLPCDVIVEADEQPLPRLRDHRPLEKNRASRG
jgi:hypothetical protein